MTTTARTGYGISNCQYCGASLKNGHVCESRPGDADVDALGGDSGLTHVQRQLRENCDAEARMIDHLADGGLSAGYLAWVGMDEDTFVDEYLWPGYTFDDVRQVKVRKFVEDVYDIETTVSQSGDYRSSRLLLGDGGPDIWFDTRTGKVEGQWGSDECVVHASSEATGLVDEFCGQLWEDLNPQVARAE
ncbi:MAG: hypothetical protein FWD75_06640 [Propionibacteriaceae bacterium]|nr:hypothetical protein [Propionibacteriaceae bacterium]